MLDQAALTELLMRLELFAAHVMEIGRLRSPCATEGDGSNLDRLLKNRCSPFKSLTANGACLS